jgi:hypothetical protein
MLKAYGKKWLEVPRPCPLVLLIKIACREERAFASEKG